MKLTPQFLWCFQPNSTTLVGIYMAFSCNIDFFEKYQFSNFLTIDVQDNNNKNVTFFCISTRKSRFFLKMCVQNLGGIKLSSQWLWEVL